MKKINYRFNPATLTMDKVEITFRDLLRRVGWPLVIGLLLGVGFFLLFVVLFPSPREKQLLDRYNSVEERYEMLEKEVDQMQLVMLDLQQRDENLYRALLQAEPLPMSVRLNGLQRPEYYDSIYAMSGMRLAADLSAKVDVLEKSVYAQAKSYDEILALAKEQQVKLECIPSIQPVLNKDLTRTASGYGWRIDPVYHTPRFHSGMDFTAPKGTDVYATGNARVVFVGWKQGYGNCIDLDHGFQYTTRYAHLSKSLVRPGQTVKRGDIIGLVGNTGKSTGPHLHYEVLFRGHAVDPRNFYFQDLSPEDYDRMVQMCNNAGNMLD